MPEPHRPQPPGFFSPGTCDLSEEINFIVTGEWIELFRLQEQEAISNFKYTCAMYMAELLFFPFINTCTVLNDGVTMGLMKLFTSFSFMPNQMSFN